MGHFGIRRAKNTTSFLICVLDDFHAKISKKKYVNFRNFTFFLIQNIPKFPLTFQNHFCFLPCWLRKAFFFRYVFLLKFFGFLFLNHLFFYIMFYALFSKNFRLLWPFLTYHLTNYAICFTCGLCCFFCL